MLTIVDIVHYEWDLWVQSRRSAHRRHIASLRVQHSKATRRLLVIPALVGVYVAGEAVTYAGWNTGLQALRVCVAVILITPLVVAHLYRP